MRITVLCSSRSHPIWRRLESWCEAARTAHQVELVERLADVESGDLLLLVSCNEIVRRETRARFGKTLVIHASDVPHGRGFAPLNWQIIEGKSKIVVTLMEAADKVDSGDVWAQRTLAFEGHELFDELFGRLLDAELDLMDFAVADFDSVEPRPQPAEEGSYYRRRGPEDGRIEPDRTLAEAFNLIRASDPERYPAFVELCGYRYAVSLRKIGEAGAAVRG